MKNFESIKELVNCYKEEGSDINSMKKVALYMRYSSKNQTEDSIEYQRRKILEFCYKNNLLPINEYIDEAYTGRNDKRPDFQKMLADSRHNPPWEELMLFNLSRFCRNAWMGIKYFADIRSYGLEITSVVENFPQSPEGRFMESFYHLFNAYYSEITATHTREGIRNKALKSLHCGGTPPLGYNVDSESKEYIINEKEAEAVKMIFDLYEKNLSYQAIADKLNQAGCKTKNGSDFNKNSFDSILRQQKYTGKYIWNRGYSKTLSGKRNNRGQKDAEEQVVIENALPIIIDEQQFNRVQATLGNKVRAVVGNRTKKHYMLGGLDILKCKQCGSNLHAETSSSHGKLHQIYYCPNHKNKKCSVKRVNADKLNKLVAKIIVQRLKSSPDLNKILSQVNQNKEIDILKNRLAGNKQAIENTMHLHESKPSKFLENKLTKLIKENEKIHDKISDALKTNSLLNSGDTQEILKRFTQTLIDSDDIDIKNYIKSVIHSISVDNDEITIKIK